MLPPPPELRQEILVPHEAGHVMKILWERTAPCLGEGKAGGTARHGGAAHDEEGEGGRPDAEAGDEGCNETADPVVFYTDAD